VNTYAKALRQAAQDEALGKNGAVPVEEVPGPAPGPAPGEPGGAVDVADDHLVSLVSPAAFEAEQYRALRHVVEQMHKTDNVKIVAVSSPAIGDGKTTTALNLAGALAQSPDAKVLIIDADVRRPSIGGLLRHVGAHTGLVDAILDPACSLDQVLVARPQFNLSFIPSGQNMPSSPYELLKSARLGLLLEEARQRFDYVIVDTPPLPAVQDCRLIARWVDGFIVVVAANRTPRRLVEEALAIIEPAKIFGLVFNGDRDRRHIRHYGYVGGYLHARPTPSDGRGTASGARGAKWPWRRRGEAR
jgi:capsular exopolysaccharide synthesis family protein